MLTEGNPCAVIMGIHEAPAATVESTTRSAGAFGTERSHVRLSVRDIREARHFYKQIFTIHEESSSEDILRMRIDDQYIICVQQKGLGADGRVASIFRLGSSRFVPVRQRIAVDRVQWRATLRNLRRHGVDHEVRARSDWDEHLAGIPRINLIDPSGNALEVLAASSAGERFWRRRWFRSALGGVAALMLTGLLVYRIWRPEQPTNEVSGNNADVVFRHLP